MPRFAVSRRPRCWACFPKRRDLARCLAGCGVVAERPRRRSRRPEWSRRPVARRRDPATRLLNPQGPRAATPWRRSRIGWSRCSMPASSPWCSSGDCSILLGLHPGEPAAGRAGLLFLDGHADFYQPEAEPNGEAASMDLALVTGRGPDLVTDALEGRAPLVRDEDATLLAHRDTADAGEPWRPAASRIPASASSISTPTRG